MEDVKNITEKGGEQKRSENMGWRRKKQQIAWGLNRVIKSPLRIAAFVLGWGLIFYYSSRLDFFPVILGIVSVYLSMFLRD